MHAINLCYKVSQKCILIYIVAFICYIDNFIINVYLYTESFINDFNFKCFLI